MATRRSIWATLLALPALIAARPSRVRAQAAPSPTGAPGEMMLTVFLRHDETKTVDEINQHLKQTGGSGTSRLRAWRSCPGTS